MSKTRTSSSPKGASPRGALRSAVTAGALMLGVAGLSAGCLDRPVQPQEPNTSNVFVKTVPTSSIDKIDLLFMIDNSISMADKQEILKEAVPNLLRRLIEPDCFDAQGVKKDKVNGECPSGSKFEFNPINNIHIGAITSALGAHGGTRCTGNNDPSIPSFPNDRAQLLPTVRTGLAAEPAGFLAWTGGDSAAVTNLVDTFRSHVEAASEYGCGYEASLEAVYRFLIDPNPPVDIERNANTGNQNRPVLVAPEMNPVLAQRDAFLRSDSLVAIVMLSDENDCSILDVQSGWAVSSDDYAFSPVSEVCDTNPNDKCCYSCAFDVPSGCSASARCATGAPLPPEQNRANVRCAQQKKRFGFDLLWPVQRYIDGLTQTTIRDYWVEGQPEVPNPLFKARNGASPRNQNLVFLAGIVGVPWQDLATADTVDPNAGLRYQSAAEMRANGVWDTILGDQGNGVLPKDPLMIESVEPRTGTHPITGEAISLTGWSNQVNGNEYDNTKGAFPGDTQPLPPNDDLQYACVFELTTPVDCSLPENADACDCADNLDKGKSLCMQGPGSAPGSTQYHAKAYPGTRFLEVLKGIGEVNAGIDNAIVASICPKHPVNPANPTDANAGYNPAVGAIIDRLGEVLGGQCLPRELDIDESGRVPCYVIEASTSLNDPGCAKAGRKPVEDAVTGAVRRQLKTEGYCGDDIGVPCTTVQMCEIQQLTEDPGRTECFNEANPTTPGYCYIDPGKGSLAGGQCDAEGNNCVNQFTEDCPASGKRKLRFVSGPGDAKIPANGTIMLTACVDSN